MRAVIFTEGGKTKGLGHIARSAAFYEGLRERGINPEVVVDTDIDAAAFFPGAAYRCEAWPSSFETTERFARGADIAILDSYHAPAEIYSFISQHVRTAVFFDDFMRLNYPPGYVINGGVSALQLSYPKASGVTYYCGSLFAFLRREFWDIEPAVLRPEVKKVLVIFGGADGQKMTARTIDRFQKGFKDFEYSVIVGPAFQDEPFLERAGRMPDIRFHRFLSASQIAAAMREADIAVSGGGQAMCELARLGVPAVSVMIAENQRGHWQGMIDRGFAVDGGCASDPDVAEKIFRGVCQLLSAQERQRRSSAGRALIDGQGVRRCVDSLLKDREKK